MNAKPSIEFDKNADIELRGLLDILQEHTARRDRDYCSLGQLTDQELVTIWQQANNTKDSSLAGLRLLGDLVSSHNEKICALDHNNVGGLTKHLADTIEAMVEIEQAAAGELAQRGFDSLGGPLPPTK